MLPASSLLSWHPNVVLLLTRCRKSLVALCFTCWTTGTVLPPHLSCTASIGTLTYCHCTAAVPLHCCRIEGNMLKSTGEMRRQLDALVADKERLSTGGLVQRCEAIVSRALYGCCGGRGGVRRGGAYHLHHSMHLKVCSLFSDQRPHSLSAGGMRASGCCDVLPCCSLFLARMPEALKHDHITQVLLRPLAWSLACTPPGVLSLTLSHTSLSLTPHSIYTHTPEREALRGEKEKLLRALEGAKSDLTNASARLQAMAQEKREAEQAVGFVCFNCFGCGCVCSRGSPTAPLTLFRWSVCVCVWLVCVAGCAQS